MQDGARDFDFLFGEWTIRNERLVERLVGATEWETFDAFQVTRPILGGGGNVDDFATEWSGGFRGLSLRLYEVADRRWTIYWAGNRTGVLEPPVHGRFEAGVGTFFGRDHHRETAVGVRYLWSDITATTALWQQAFTVDDGQTWETNWRMHFKRVA